MPRILIRLASTGLLVTALNAEIHPQFYAEWQRTAPEQLLFVVEKVEPEERPNDEYFDTRIIGKVVRVFHSEAYIRKDQKVEIRYTVFQPRKDYAGPKPMPYLSRGATYPVYAKALERMADGTWLLEPVAGGRSFEVVSYKEGKP